MSEQARAADVAGAVAGDGDALQRLILRYHVPLRRAVVSATADDLRIRVDPEDILQQAYVDAFKGVRGCSFDGPGGFYRWLETIAISRLRDQERALRSQKRDVARETPIAVDPSTTYPQLIDRLAGNDSSPSHHMARDEAVAAVMSSLARLGDDQRAVVQLRYLEGRSVAEVAQHLGKSEAAVHMLCHRGLKALRERMISLTRYLSHD